MTADENNGVQYCDKYKDHFNTMNKLSFINSFWHSFGHHDINNNKPLIYTGEQIQASFRHQFTKLYHKLYQNTRRITVSRREEREREQASLAFQTINDYKHIKTQLNLNWEITGLINRAQCIYYKNRQGVGRHQRASRNRRVIAFDEIEHLKLTIKEEKIQLPGLPLLLLLLLLSHPLTTPL